MIEHPPMTLPPGARLGPYEIVSMLGAGGMGEVYRARDTRLARTVALKVIDPELAGEPAPHARFEREARAGSVRLLVRLLPLPGSTGTSVSQSGSE